MSCGKNIKAAKLQKHFVELVNIYHYHVLVGCDMSFENQKYREPSRIIMKLGAQSRVVS